jgi:CRISPR system Cascade subunit CasA
MWGEKKMETHAKRRFNLVDENWIPVAGEGLVSLRRVFADPGLKALGGNPVEKIALTKLILAIAQAAYTPKDDDEWARLGAMGMAEKAVSYLEENRDLFWLYGDRPFLQMPAVEKVPKRSFGTGFYPDMPAENNTILFQCQIDNGLSDPQRAVFLVTLMGFALGGKRIGKPIILSNGYTGKTISAKAGPNLGYAGYLHNYLIGITLQESLWLNLYALERIKNISTFISGIGLPPWERMPIGEDCETAKVLKNSYMGCLLPLCRFVLFADDGLHYTEGIQYPNHKAGWREPSIAYNEGKKKVEMIWVNPQKKPWRELTSILSFVSATSQSSRSFECRQIQDHLHRACKIGIRKIGIWSGGLRVTENSGDQSVKKNDDYIESEIFFVTEWFEKGIWFIYLKAEMERLEEIAKVTYGATIGYFKHQKADGKNQAAMATNLFWQFCERKFQNLINACGDESGQESGAMRRIFVDYANRAFNAFCPRETARQLEAWAANRPNLGRFLQDVKNG